MLNLGGYLLLLLASRGRQECNWCTMKRDHSGKEEVVQYNEILHCVVNMLIVNVSRGTFFQIFSSQLLNTCYVFDPGLDASKAVINQIILYFLQV